LTGYRFGPALIAHNIHRDNFDGAIRPRRITGILAT